MNAILTLIALVIVLALGFGAILYGSYKSHEKDETAMRNSYEDGEQQ